MIDDYTLDLIQNGVDRNITSITGNVTRRSSISTLGEEFTFSVGKLPGIKKISAGDGILFRLLEDEVFRGIIIDENESGLFQLSYKAFDYAFYLNKSSTVIQFNGIKGDEAIKRLCKQFNIPMGFIVPIKTKIVKIYKSKPISEIIKDILSSAENELGIKYRLEMRKGKLHIEPYQNLIVKAVFKPAYNLAEIDATKLIGGFSRSRSIQDMKNSIVITSNNEKSSRVIATSKNDDSISKYGLLQHVEIVDEKNISQARNISRNKLTELNKVVENTTIQLLGDDSVRAGRILEINDPVTGLSGYYLVKECTHNYSKFTHFMNLNIESINLKG